MAYRGAPAPAPLYIDKRRTSSSATSTSISPDSYMEPAPLHSRTSSSSSTDSGYSSSGRKQSQTPASPRNVYTHCGRHTDQYLFGGKGFTDMWRAITKKE